jgi:hypothetical protein
LCSPLFGTSDSFGSRRDGSQFQASRDPLCRAAAEFSRHGQATNFPQLREAVRSALAPFLGHLRGVEGDATSSVIKRFTNVFDLAASILKEPEIAGVFGVQGKIDPKWPLGSDDSNGALLMEAVSSTLEVSPSQPVSREAFISFQRIAEKGCKSIFMVLEEDMNDDAKIDQAIVQLFSWGRELGIVG